MAFLKYALKGAMAGGKTVVSKHCMIVHDTGTYAQIVTDIKELLDDLGYTYADKTVAEAIALLGSTDYDLWIVLSKHTGGYHSWTPVLCNDGVVQGVLYLAEAYHFEVQNMYFGIVYTQNKTCTCQIPAHAICLGVASTFVTHLQDVWDDGVDGGKMACITLSKIITVYESASRPLCPYVTEWSDATHNLDGDRIVGLAIDNDDTTTLLDQRLVIKNCCEYCAGIT